MLQDFLASRVSSNEFEQGAKPSLVARRARADFSPEADLTDSNGFKGDNGVTACKVGDFWG